MDFVTDPIYLFADIVEIRYGSLPPNVVGKLRFSAILFYIRDLLYTMSEIDFSMFPIHHFREFVEIRYARLKVYAFNCY
jgi:hypothetical protein